MSENYLEHLKHRINTGSLGGDQDVKAVEQLIADLDSAYESLEAQMAKFDGCPHKHETEDFNGLCGCSFDKPTDVCMVHAPQLRKALAVLAQKTRECEELKERLADEELAFNHANEIVAKYVADEEAHRAQVEQLGRQVAEMSRPLTDEEKSKIGSVLVQAAIQPFTPLTLIAIGSIAVKQVDASRARTK